MTSENPDRWKINLFCDIDTLVIIDRQAKAKGVTRSAIIRAALNEKFLLTDGDIPVEVRHEALERKVEQLQRVVAILAGQMRQMTEKLDSFKPDQD